MHRIAPFLLAVFIALPHPASCGNAEGSQYLGQEPPGTVPVIFAPGIVSSEGTTEYCMAFTPDGRELFFSRGGAGVMRCVLTDSTWTGPQTAPFAEKYPGGEIHISQDRQRLFMNRYQGLADGEVGGVYILTEENGAWGNPRLLAENGMRATTTAAGEIFATDITWFRNKQEGKDTGIIARFVPSGTEYKRVADPGGGINTEYEEAHPFIAPDGSYIIFNSSRPGGAGKGDLYVCYKGKDGSWREAVNLASLNTIEADWCATVTPDGKYIFFTRNITGRGDIYWVDAGIIEEMRPKE